MNDYYKLIQQIRNDDKVIDNDLVRFKEQKAYKMRNVQPSSYLYHDYYYNYMKMHKRMSIHDDIVNFAQIDSDNINPWARENGNRVIGYQKQYGPQHAQPIFDEEFFNKIQYKSKSMIYSRKK